MLDTRCEICEHRPKNPDSDPATGQCSGGWTAIFEKGKWTARFGDDKDPSLCPSFLKNKIKTIIIDGLEYS